MIAFPGLAIVFTLSDGKQRDAAGACENLIMCLCQVGIGRIGEMGCVELRPDADSSGRALCVCLRLTEADRPRCVFCDDDTFVAMAAERSKAELAACIAAAEKAKSDSAASL